MAKKETQSREIRRHGYELLRYLSQNRDKLSPLLIMTHDYPDPDALGSAFALHYLAETGFGIQARIVYGGVIGRSENKEMVRLLKIPVHKVKPRDFKKYASIALLDTQPAFENNSFPKNRKVSIVIDQHPSVTKPLADLAIVDSECGATSVILAEAILSIRSEVPVRLATALAYGILSDTLNLYRVKRQDDIRTYLDILHHCDMKLLARIQNPSHSRAFFATLGRGLQNAMMTRKLVISHLGTVNHPDLISQIADFLLTFKGAERAFCTGRYKGKLHASLRLAKCTANAGEILRDAFLKRGQAGGHDSIAGGSLPVGLHASEENWVELENALQMRLLKRFRIATKRPMTFPFRQKI